MWGKGLQFTFSAILLKKKYITPGLQKFTFHTHSIVASFTLPSVKIHWTKQVQVLKNMKKLLGHKDYHVSVFLSVKHSFSSHRQIRNADLKKTVCTIFYINKVETKSEKYVLIVIPSIFMIKVLNPVCRTNKIYILISHHTTYFCRKCP